MSDDYSDIPDEVLPKDIVIDGRKATITYLDKWWNPVTEAEATMAIALFDDGGKEIYVITHDAEQ
jgi:hypothetical protein